MLEVYPEFLIILKRSCNVNRIMLPKVAVVLNVDPWGHSRLSGFLDGPH